MQSKDSGSGGTLGTYLFKRIQDELREGPLDRLKAGVDLEGRK